MDMIIKIRALKSNKLVRMLATTMALALVLMGSITAYAATNNYELKAKEIESFEIAIPLPTPSQGDAKEIAPVEDEDITILEVTPINNDHYTGTAYERTFTCDPDNGKKLNIYVKNNGTTTVKFKVTHGSQDFGYVNVSGGSGKTRTFTMNDGGGISGEWTVYVTTDTGARMDINVNARQF